MSNAAVGDIMFPNLNEIEVRCREALTKSVATVHNNTLIKRIIVYRRTVRSRLHMKFERRLPRQQMYPNKTNSCNDNLAKTAESRIGKMLCQMIQAIEVSISRLPWSLQHTIKPYMKKHKIWLQNLTAEYEEVDL